MLCINVILYLMILSELHILIRIWKGNLYIMICPMQAFIDVCYSHKGQRTDIYHMNYLHLIVR